MKNTPINKTSIESDLNHHHVKYEDPLWNENDYDNSGKKTIGISLRYTDYTDPKKAYEWDFYEQKKFKMTLYGKDFSKKYINYFLSKEGIQDLLKLYKSGYKTPAKIKEKLKI